MNTAAVCTWCGRAGHWAQDCKVPRDVQVERPRPTAYIAGPMSGLQDFNRPAFHDAAAKLRRLGYVVENPAECSLPEGSEWSAYMRSGITQLMRCSLIVMLPGWEKSRGATIEHALAGQLGIECMPLHEALSRHG